MNQKQSHDFLTGKLAYTPQRMLAYIKSRARISTHEDIEDILQNALVLVVKYYDSSRSDANLSSFCMGACNKAIAQNIERYHRMQVNKVNRAKDLEQDYPETNQDVSQADNYVNDDGESVKVLKSSHAGSKSSKFGGYNTVSLDSMFDCDEEKSYEDVLGESQGLNRQEVSDPLNKTLLNELIELILAELPSQNHKTCFILKYVHGYKREDIISCLKMDAKSIDTIDKKIVRTLKAFKEKLDSQEINSLRG